MKILIPIFSFTKSGGMKVISNLANYWIEQGHIVTIITTTEDKPYYSTSANIINLNKKEDKLSIITRIYLLYKYIKTKSLNYDTVIANYNLTAYSVFLGSKVKNIYYIQAYEPEFYDEIKNRFFKKNLLKFLAWVTYFLPLIKIVNSNMYINYKNIKTNYVVYPGINLDIYFPKERNLKKSSDIFKIGCIGRKEEWKGSEDVAEAIKILHNKGYENIEFIVAFNTVSYSNHTLVFPDGDEQLAEFYHSLDILVTPGHIQLDAIHYPVIEAMATKTPLITTGYFPSNENNSFLVPVKSPEKIAENIEYIVNNYDKAILKTNIAYKNIEEFSWKIISEKFISIIKSNNSNE